VEETYGARARALALPEDHPEELIVDVIERPQHYAEIVEDIRQMLAEKHSYAARLNELVAIVNS
jgi:hypothetical protein